MIKLLKKRAPLLSCKNETIFDKDIDKLIQKAFFKEDEILYMIDYMFVTFKTELACFECLKLNDKTNKLYEMEDKKDDEFDNCDYREDLQNMQITKAPEPSNIIWENFSSQKFYKTR